MPLFLVDCAASQFCFPGTDIHSDRSTFWRVSKSDPQSLDVWTTVHLLQVSIEDTRSPNGHLVVRGLIEFNKINVILLIGFE